MFRKIFISSRKLRRKIQINSTKSLRNSMPSNRPIASQRITQPTFLRKLDSVGTNRAAIEAIIAISEALIEVTDRETEVTAG